MRDIVLFRWKEVASQEAIDSALAELRKLRVKSQALRICHAVRTSLTGLRATRTGWSCVSQDRSAREVYGPHPEHQRVLQNFVIPIRADVLAFDYEF